MTTDPIWIGCQLKSTPRGTTAVGWIRCDVCRAKVWVAPSTLEIKKDTTRYPVVIIACLGCLAEEALRRKIADPRAPFEIYTNNEQERELLCATGKTATEIFQSEFGITPKRLK